MNYYKTFKQEKKTLILAITLTVVLSLIFSLVQPLKYSSTVKLLVVQKSSYSLDAYSALKSAERVGENISQIVYTSTFFNKMMNSGFNIDETYFPSDELKKRNFWKKMVYADVIEGSGVIEIKVFHENKKQANQIAQAITYVLTTKIGQYFDADNVSVQMVDSPIESGWPAKPNIPMNAAMAFVLGIMISAGYVVFKAQKEEFKPVYRPNPEAKIPTRIPEIKPLERKIPSISKNNIPNNLPIITQNK